MLTFNIGNFVISFSHLLLMAALLIACLVGRRVLKPQGMNVDSTLFWLLIFGLVVARVGFVLSYRQQYGDDILGIFDVRDSGFLAWPGVIAVALVAILLGWRRATQRRGLAASVLAGLLVWTLGTVSLSIYEKGMHLPDIPLRNSTGENVQLASFKGRPLVINLWATWCPPCRREMPVLQKAQQAHQDVTFLFVNQGEDSATVKRFFDHQELVLDNVVFDGGGRLGQVVGSMALPTTLFYGADGRLINSHLGELSDASLARALEQMKDR